MSSNPMVPVVTTTATQAPTNKDLTSGTNTFPTLNQNTTGSAAKWTTPRNVDGQALDGTANVTVIAPGTHAATGKTTPVDADELPIVDSAASNVLKKLTFANLKAWFKSYYDSVTTTMTSKTLTDPKISNIYDTNSNPFIAFNPQASSVNYFQMANGAAGNGIWIQAVGSDGNVAIVVAPKAAGGVIGWANSQAEMVMNAAGANTDVGWNFTTQNAGVVKANGQPVARMVSAPASASAAGTAKDIAFDSTHFYVCIATNTWVRATLATW